MAKNEIDILKQFVDHGEAEAFSEIVRRHAGMVYGVSVRVLEDDSRAADVVQETFLQLLHEADRITDSLVGWLHRVATHKAIDAIRKDRRRKKREAVYAAGKSREIGEWEHMSGHVDEAMDELDDEKRDLLIRHFLESRTMAEIAADKGVSQPTVSRQVKTALAELRTKLHKRGILVVTGVLATLMAQNAVQAAPAVVLSELGKMAMVAVAESGAAVGASATAATAGSGIVAGVKAKIIAAAAIAVIGVGGVVTYQQVTSPGNNPASAVEPAAVLAGKTENLGAAVIDGIRENRDKFECGELAWSKKTVNDRGRYFDSNEPAQVRTGQYELWWDGKKIANKFVEDRDYSDPTGRKWVEKHQGGDSYDGSLLSRKPRFSGHENWLSVTRWRGAGSHDWMILQLEKREHVTKEWSVVDVNGIKLIKLAIKNMYEEERDYGAYSVRFYDPSKGYGLVNKESYNPDGSPRSKHTVKLQEAIPGGWFPVQVDFSHFAIPDGKVFMHQHFALDIKRCSFNDRSALPEGIFTWTLERQLKEQEKHTKKLQKYLAMELNGISYVEEIDKTDTVKHAAREAAEKFVAAAMAGDFEKADEFRHPDRLPADHIKDIHETAEGQKLWIMAVLADDQSAVAVSSVIRADHSKVGPLVFHLDRVVLDGRDNWWIHDIDLRTPDKAEEDLVKFLEEHPDAKRVPDLP